MSVVELEAREVSLEGAAGGGLWSEAWYRLRRNPGAIIGFAVLVSLALVAIFAPWIAPYGSREQNLAALHGGCCPGPSADHWFGLDELGRDELSRIIYGTRY